MPPTPPRSSRNAASSSPGRPAGSPPTNSRVLVGYLADPLPSTELVIEWGSQRRTKASRRGADRGRGDDHRRRRRPNRARDRRAWVQDAAKASGVRLSAAAVELIVGHLGENVGALDGVLRTLSATFGGGATVLGPEHVEPFLGDAGGVPPWDLTDAIDSGRTGRALELLGRMLGAGERHPLQVMAILQGHYGKLATLDGRELRTEADAAAALGIKPGYPARKAMEQARRLGGHVDPPGDRPARRRRPRPPRPPRPRQRRSSSRSSSPASPASPAPDPSVCGDRSVGGRACRPETLRRPARGIER